MEGSSPTGFATRMMGNGVDMEVRVQSVAGAMQRGGAMNLSQGARFCMRQLCPGIPESVMIRDWAVVELAGTLNATNCGWKVGVWARSDKTALAIVRLSQTRRK